MKIISRESGYAMIVSGNIPKLTKTYVRNNVIDRDVWSDLFTNRSEETLRMAIRRHLDGLGTNVTSQLMAKLVIDEDLVKYCKAKYLQY